MNDLEENIKKKIIKNKMNVKKNLGMRIADDLTKSEILIGIKSCLIYLDDVSDFFKRDRDVVLEAVKNDGYVLKQTSDELKNDEEIVLEAVKKRGTALKYDKNIVMQAVRQSGWALEYVSDRLKDDKEVVISTIKIHGLTLKFASERLQNDKEVLECLKKTVRAFYSGDDKKWYEERMELLANMREKEFMEKSIVNSNIKNKKIKF